MCKNIYQETVGNFLKYIIFVSFLLSSKTGKENLGFHDFS